MGHAEIIAAMRERAGSRQKLAAMLDVSVSAAQAWEKDESIPDGRSMAGMYKHFPDLTVELLEELAGNGKI